MMTNWGFSFPKEPRQFYWQGGFIGISGSRSFRAHDTMSDDQLDDLWELGEEIAGSCEGFGKLGEVDPDMSCVTCDNLPDCTGESQGVRPNLFRLLKAAFRHDMIFED